LSDPANILYPAKRIIVLAPHPDDETIGCGGTIAKLARSGSNVCILFVSRGDAVNVKVKGLADIRENEAHRACEILGVQELVFRDFPDGKLEKHYDEVKDSVRGVIKSYNPDIIFTPSVMDLHPDHVTASKIALSLLKEFASFKVAFYEVYSPIRYNCLIDITDVIDIKRKAVMCYHYSLLEKPEDILFAMEGLNAYRSFEFIRKGFFEAFYVIDSADSEDTVIEWLTHGLSREASSCKFLSQLKKVDQLLAAYQQSLKKIDELEKKERKSYRCEDKQTSFGHGAATRVLGRIRDGFFPLNTKRRRLYETVINRMRSKR
jgi:N-acetylglucosamine malate deacetylase 1